VWLAETLIKGLLVWIITSTSLFLMGSTLACECYFPFHLTWLSTSRHMWTVSRSHDLHSLTGNERKSEGVMHGSLNIFLCCEMFYCQFVVSHFTHMWAGIFFFIEILAAVEMLHSVWNNQSFPLVSCLIIQITMKFMYLCNTASQEAFCSMQFMYMSGSN
jgi:hypothetical protein